MVIERVNVYMGDGGGVGTCVWLNKMGERG